MPSAFPYHSMHAIDVLRHFGNDRGRVVSSGEIKPGDIFWVRAGSVIPAHGRIISCKDFRTDVIKNNLPGDACMVSAGELVTKGMAEIIAIAPLAPEIRQSSSIVSDHPFRGAKKIKEIRDRVRQITGTHFQKHFAHQLCMRDAVSPNRFDILVDEIPYHEDSKFAASLWRREGGYKIRAWGDARSLLSRSDIDDRGAKAWHHAIRGMDSQGYASVLFAERDLALASDFQKAAQTDLVPLVLIGLS